ncbi:MAG TPA: hypothetical protein VNL77_18810, partial [Roseiflexaceae bacterium]|nr:hypothetical protein [Roseiflexaceae bacterium]
PAVPAPLFVSIAAREDLGGATLSLRAAPRGRALEGAPTVSTATIPGTPVVYKAQLELDRPGDWELEVVAEGPRGAGRARIPFSVTPAPLPPHTVPLLVSLGGLFLLLLAGVLVAAVSQSRGRAPPRRTSWALGQAAFAFGVAAAIFGGQQIAGSFQAASSAGTPGDGRPHVNVALRTEPAQPVAGQELLLALELSDGGTGLAVDDLAPHHEALLHLVVIDETGAAFEHLHPARESPGRFVARFTPARPGRHTAYIELARHESGTQVVARDFLVTGKETAAPPAPPGLGLREVDGLQIDVTSSVPAPQAGRQAVLTFRLAAGGRPVADVQPWLGMAGHLIARSADGAVFSHVHAAEPPAPPGPLGQGTRYGPEIRFVYTFPAPGYYHLWAQFQRDGRIVTVPLALDVAE